MTTIYWPRWKALPEGYEVASAGHTERALLLRRRDDAPPLPKAQPARPERRTSAPKKK